MNSIAILVARFLLALLFLVSAVRQAMYRHGGGGGNGGARHDLHAIFSWAAPF